MILEGDLLLARADVIVNAANTHLEHMGGIAGAISRAAGPELQRESRAKRPIPTGEACVTTAGALPFKAVVHAVGPIWSGGGVLEPELLALAHKNAIWAADELEGVRKIAFPALSCGIFRFPVERAAPIAIRAVWAALPFTRHIEEVQFHLLDPKHFEAFRAASNAAEFSGRRR